MTETDGRDNLASPHKTRCHHHAVALFTDAAATYATRKHTPFSRSSRIQKHHIISQLIKRQRKTGAPIWRPGRRARSQIFTSTDRTCCLADCSFIRKHSGITCVKEWVSCRKTTHPDNDQNTNTAHVSVQ